MWLSGEALPLGSGKNRSRHGLVGFNLLYSNVTDSDYSQPRKFLLRTVAFAYSLQ